MDSYNLQTRRLRMRKRQEQLRAEREHEEVLEHFREIDELVKRNKARTNLLQYLQFISSLGPLVASYGDADGDLERVRDEVIWTLETVGDIAAIFNKAVGDEKIQRRIGKLRALEESANPNEAAVARAMREREEQKL